MAASKPDKATPATQTSLPTTSNVQEDVVAATPKAIEPAIEVNIFKEATSGKVNSFFFFTEKKKKI